MRGRSGKEGSEDRAHRRVQNCRWRPPSDVGRGLSIQLSRKLAGYWVNSAEQERVRHARGHNQYSPNKGGTPAPGGLPPNRASTGMQNRWPTLPGPGARVWDPYPYESSRVQELAGNRRERSEERRVGKEC